MYDKQIKVYTYVNTTLVTSKPCWLYSLIASENSTTAKFLKIFNGQSAAAELKMFIYVSSYDNFVIVFNEPVFFEHGLYLLFDTDLDSVMVQYKEE